MRGIALAALTAALALVVGCGSDSDSEASAGTAAAATEGTTSNPAASEDEATRSETATASKKKKGTTVKVVGSQYGRVIADGKGEAFYLFDKESSKRSRCYGECARAWPPVLTKGKPRAGKGAKAKLLGTTKRRNGKRQVTYAGHPVYYYVDDSPGTILCQNVDEFGGLWLVVKPNGKPVT